MIKFNGNNINKWLKGTSQVNKVYKGEVSCYPDITNDAPTPPTPPTPSYDTEYLTFVATESGTFTFTPQNSNVIYYSTDDGSTWTEGNSVNVSVNDKVLWKGTMTPSTTYHKYGIGLFSSNGRFIAQGNIMSLLYGDNFEGQTSLATTYAFYALFSGCTTITSAENMVLPTILQRNCYHYMFAGCSSLTTAPQLLATTLADYCYFRMFNNCTSLTSIICLATDISATQCTTKWVNGVAASGTFTKAASMNDWTTGTNGIPDGWTVQDYQG